MTRRRSVADYRRVDFVDRLLADGSVHRQYTDGLEEWRWLEPTDGDGPARVAWRDNRGSEGIDEQLGRGLVLRTIAGGPAVYGRDQGYGLTAWSDGVLTCNRTTFAGRAGSWLASNQVIDRIHWVQPPPDALRAPDVVRLRQEAQDEHRRRPGRHEAGHREPGYRSNGGSDYDVGASHWGTTGGDADMFSDFG